MTYTCRRPLNFGVKKKLGLNIELWRMWSFDSEEIKDGLKVRSFKSKSVYKSIVNNGN